MFFFMAGGLEIRGQKAEDEQTSTTLHGDQINLRKRNDQLVFLSGVLHVGMCWKSPWILSYPRHLGALRDATRLGLHAS